MFPNVWEEQLQMYSWGTQPGGSEQARFSGSSVLWLRRAQPLAPLSLSLSFFLIAEFSSFQTLEGVAHSRFERYKPKIGIYSWKHGKKKTHERIKKHFNPGRTPFPQIHEVDKDKETEEAGIYDSENPENRTHKKKKKCPTH